MFQAVRQRGNSSGSSVHKIEYNKPSCTSIEYLSKCVGNNKSICFTGENKCIDYKNGVMGKECCNCSQKCQEYFLSKETSANKILKIKF